MSQIIVEQQFHYTVKMTSNKHSPNAIYANRDAKIFRKYLNRLVHFKVGFQSLG